MTSEEKNYEMPLEDLPAPPRLLRIMGKRRFAGGDVFTVGDLLQVRMSSIWYTQNFGIMLLQDLLTVLQEAGYLPRGVTAHQLKSYVDSEDSLKEVVESISSEESDDNSEDEPDFVLKLKSTIAELQPPEFTSLPLSTKTQVLSRAARNLRGFLIAQLEIHHKREEKELEEELINNLLKACNLFLENEEEGNA